MKTQKVKLSLKLPKKVAIKAKAEVTTGGLLAIGALVSAILLSTTVLVGVSVREGTRRLT